MRKWKYSYLRRNGGAREFIKNYRSKNAQENVEEMSILQVSELLRDDLMVRKSKIIAATPYKVYFDNAWVGDLRLSLYCVYSWLRSAWELILTRVNRCNKSSLRVVFIKMEALSLVTCFWWLREWFPKRIWWGVKLRQRYTRDNEILRPFLFLTVTWSVQSCRRDVGCVGFGNRSCSRGVWAGEH